MLIRDYVSYVNPSHFNFLVRACQCVTKQQIPLYVFALFIVYNGDKIKQIKYRGKYARTIGNWKYVLQRD